MYELANRPYTIDTGRASREAGSIAMRELWQIATQLNERSGTAQGEFVPWRAIVIDERSLPRDQVKQEWVEAFRQDVDEFPPIVVQRDTFVLLDGHHRLLAVARAPRDHVRIIEVDVEDGDLWERAFEANARHGIPLTAAERRKAALHAIDVHSDRGSSRYWTDEEIARWAGVSPRSVWGWRQSAPTNATDDPDPRIAGDSQFASSSQTEVNPAAGEPVELPKPVNERSLHVQPSSPLGPSAPQPPLAPPLLPTPIIAVDLSLTPAEQQHRQRVYDLVNPRRPNETLRNWTWAAERFVAVAPTLAASISLNPVAREQARKLILAHREAADALEHALRG
jgi:hypothetical protein